MNRRDVVISAGAAMTLVSCSPVKFGGRTEPTASALVVSVAGALPIKFESLRNKYPREEREKLFRDVLGAGFANLVGNGNYENTCAIRMSLALNRIGVKIPEDLWRADGGHYDRNNYRILIKVKSVFTLLDKLFGVSWGQSKNPGEPLNFSDVPRWQGVIGYHANFNNADGHVDIWVSKSCYFHCPTPDVQKAFDVVLWKI